MHTTVLRSFNIFGALQDLVGGYAAARPTWNIAEARGTAFQHRMITAVRSPLYCATRGQRGAGAMIAVALLYVVACPVYAETDDEAVAIMAALRIEARTYEHGEGVARNTARAVDLYCEASRMGDAAAQFSLGWMYANARGVPRDNRLASLFFSMAAAQGHTYAQKMLAFVGPSAADLPECMRDPVPPATEETTVDEVFVASTPDQKKVAELVGRLAPEYRISPLLALAIIRAESNFDPNARSPKNAQGLMQLVPETSARFNVRKPFDPIQNVRGGLAYLRWLLAYFRGDVALVAAAYNSGEGTVERYRGIPPYPETRAYVNRIRRYFRKDSHPYDETVTDPSPELARIGVMTAR
ncbi:MAG: transglycosylase SLT domain-containing protein [Betaproteobacteria bacterium]|nr:transglycosylase SLT domain-containing protein [Betaproteobacteria bacterium]MDH3412958.1 transglycosylase SLT domain-containing protein [Gammaproteobacteria bacterium]